MTGASLRPGHAAGEQTTTGLLGAEMLSRRGVTSDTVDTAPAVISRWFLRALPKIPEQRFLAHGNLVEVSSGLTVFQDSPLRASRIIHFPFSVSFTH